MARFDETRATLVTISIGINDLLQGTDEQQFTVNYEELLSRLMKTGVPIVVTNLPDITVAPAISGVNTEDLNIRLQLFNKRIEELARSRGLRVVNLYQESLNTPLSSPDLFSADGLHPSDAGYESWAETMWPEVKKAINR
jgi:lysophospholipase L1-like esterase